MSKKKYIGLFAFLFVVLFFYRSFLKDGDCEREKAIVKVAINVDPPSLDPRVARDVASLSVLKMLFEGLTRINQKGVPEPALAQNIQMSSDGLIYEFELKKTFWSNGDPLTVHDIVYAWKKVLDPTFPSPYAYQLYPLKNAKNIKQGIFPLDSLGVEILDDYKMKVVLEAPVPYFLQLLAAPVYFPVHQKNSEANPEWSSKASSFYLCNGPFILSDWKQNSIVSLRKNDFYWDRNAVHLDGVDLLVSEDNTALQMFEKKDLDWIGSPLGTLPVDALEDLKKQKNFHKVAASAVQFFRFNTSQVPFDDVRIRKAFALALNRQDLVDHVTRGGQLPSLGLIPPNLSQKQIQYYKDNDLQTAKKLFNDVLKERNLDADHFPEVKLTFATSSVAISNQSLAQAIQQQWREAFGIVVQLDPIESKVFFQKIGQKDYQMALGGWYADIADPVDFLNVFKYKNESTNNTNWENPSYIEMLNASDVELDPSKRRELLSFAEEILMNDMPVSPTYFPVGLYVHSDRLKGVYVSDLLHIDLKWAYVD